MPELTPSADATPGELIARITPARLFVGRAGTSLPTGHLLALRADHAAARDAVGTSFDLAHPEIEALIGEYQFVAVQSAARSAAEYLRRPELGRVLAPESEAAIRAQCPAGADVQIVVGDGLSATAVYAQVPLLLPRIVNGIRDAGLTTGRPIAVHRCRVGILNAIGDVLRPRVVLLLIGERPGLATAESLSAYFAYRPRSEDTDAQRNLVANIHQAGVLPEHAVRRILGMIRQLLVAQASGVEVKEELPALEPSRAV